MSEPNVLLLDEPTNDLDLETMGILESFIEDFNGAIIFVSHDRFFVDRMARKVFVYEGNGRIGIYPGGYTDYAVRKEAEEAQLARSQVQQKKHLQAQQPETSKPQRKKSAGLTF